MVDGGQTAPWRHTPCHPNRALKSARRIRSSDRIPATFAQRRVRQRTWTAFRGAQALLDLVDCGSSVEHVIHLAGQLLKGRCQDHTSAFLRHVEAVG